MTDKPRHYDDREVGLILRRVAELHEAQRAQDSGEVWTHEQLEEAVADLGMPKALVAKAAAELAPISVRNEPVPWLGGPTEAVYETRRTGRVKDNEFARMQEVLRRELGDPGVVTREGPTRIWSTSDATTRRVWLTLHEEGDSTVVRLEERMPMDARARNGVPTIVGLMVGVLSMIPLKALVAKTVLLALLVPSFAVTMFIGWQIGRQLWRRESGRRNHQLTQLFAELDP